jgi:hypothetical protein
MLEILILEPPEDSGGLSMDIAALVMTAVLGMLSFVVQSRVAKATDLNQREIEVAQESFAKERARSNLQLERVRNNMAIALVMGHKVIITHPV